MLRFYVFPLDANKSNTRNEYKALLDAFTATVEDIDPLWHEREGRVAKAWDNIKMLILDILDGYLPEESAPDTHKELEALPDPAPPSPSPEEGKKSEKGEDDVNQELL